MWLQLDISEKYADHVFPVERAEMTSSATVDDQDFLLATSVYQSEAFVSNVLD